MFDPDSKAVSGVIDWDLSSEIGLPYLDILYLLAYNRVNTEKRSTNDIVASTVLPGAFSAREQDLLTNYALALELPEDLLDCLRVMFWAHHIAYRISVDPNMAQVVSQLLEVTEVAARTITNS